jgi:hypothetical protein
MFVGSAIPATNGVPSTFVGVAIPESLGVALPPMMFFRLSIVDFLQTGTRYFIVATDAVIYHDHAANIANGGMNLSIDTGAYEVINGISLESPVIINDSEGSDNPQEAIQ